MHSNTILQERLYAASRLIEGFYRNLLLPFKGLLAVFGSMALANRTRPLSLLFQGTSGSGKTTVLQMALPLDEENTLNTIVYRSDKFTPKAFVSHAANVSKKQLEAIDMLPKLEHKVLITKELAPIFRGRKEDLTEIFSMLISVLDGKGFMSDSGIQGRRGYDRPIIFNWLGATTPLLPATYRLMSQLGNRVLFFEMASVEPLEDELIAFTKADAASRAEADCQKAVNDLLCEFFKTHPIASVTPDTIQLPMPLNKQIVRWARLVAKGRAEIKYERDRGMDWQPVGALPAEAPFRVIEYFKEVSRGHALIHGRTEINSEDLELIGHIAISSIPGHLRPILRELRKGDAVVTSRCADLCGVSSPTARKYLFELHFLGIGDLKKGSPSTNLPDSLTLSPDFQWLRLSHAESDMRHALRKQSVERPSPRCASDKP